ncbi:MAG TPA: TIGR03118 family protein [Candidatus Dormibacteraeota bacterium]|nr:TIGR03118 family protein [Candidatus Dormibacteraeota bacterium]
MATLSTAAVLTFTPASAEDNGIAARSYVQTNLVSDIPGLAKVTDSNLKNPWGTSTGPGLPIWVSDNNAGVTTLYSGAGNPIPLQAKPPVNAVAIPAPPSAGTGALGAPTGTVFNSTGSGFVVSKNGVSGSSRFLFATEDGTIVGWSPNVDRANAIIAVDRSTVTDPSGDVGAVYKGLALVTTTAGTFLYASNFRFGTVEVFDSSFTLVSSFTDPTVPAGFAPFGIHNIGGSLFVTFAEQNAQKHDDVAGPGNGFVDRFSPGGVLLQRFVSEGRLNSPWAVTKAPSTFGAFGGAILVGNFGDGHINAYDPSTGHLEGQLRNATGDPLTIPDLWGLRFAAGSLNAVPGALYFTAGINNEQDGLLGDIVPRS